MNFKVRKIKILLVLSVIAAVSSVVFFSFSNKASADVCQVTSADWRTGATYPSDNFIANNNNPYVYIDIQTTGCVGSTVNLEVMSYSAYPNSVNIDNFLLGHVLNFGQLDIPIISGMESFTLEFKAADENCHNSAYWDCRYFIVTSTIGNFYPASVSLWQTIYDDGNIALPNMMLEYDCDGGLYCPSEFWDYVSPAVPYGSVNAFDVYRTPPVTVPSVPSDAFLAPLPGFSAGATSSLGGFLQALFTVLILIAGVLAFVMVVIGAITYLSSDAFSGKSEGKAMMLNAVFGLILALGAWLILNTINPNLASNLEINISDVSLDAPPVEFQNGNAPTGTNIAHTKTLNGQPILQGMPWPSDDTQRTQLQNHGINVASSQNSNCPTAGTLGCTSVYFETTAASVIQQIIDFKTTCGDCEIVITGGSEAWLHATHGPNVKIVDMRATPTLNAYLNGLPSGPAPGSNFPPGGPWITLPGVGQFYAEPNGATGNTTEHHWHVIFD